MKSKISYIAALLSIIFFFTGSFFFYQTYFNNLVTPLGHFAYQFGNEIEYSFFQDKSMSLTIGFAFMFTSVFCMLLGYKEFINGIRMWIVISLSSLLTIGLNYLFPMFTFNFQLGDLSSTLNLAKFLSVEFIIFSLLSLWITAFIIKNKGKIANCLKWYSYGLVMNLSLIVFSFAACQNFKEYITYKNDSENKGEFSSIGNMRNCESQYTVITWTGIKVKDCYYKQFEYNNKPLTYSERTYISARNGGIVAMFEFSLDSFKHLIDENPSNKKLIISNLIRLYQKNHEKLIQTDWLTENRPNLVKKLENSTFNSKIYNKYSYIKAQRSFYNNDIEFLKFMSENTDNIEAIKAEFISKGYKKSPDKTIAVSYAVYQALINPASNSKPSSDFTLESWKILESKFHNSLYKETD